MSKKTLFLLIFSTLISIINCPFQPVKAVQVTLNNGSNSAIFNDDSNSGYYGFNSWELDSQQLLTATGLFYQVGNSGEIKTLDTLTTSTSNPNSNSTTINYVGNGFTLDLDLSLSNSGSILNQTATVENTSNAALDFDLYTYFDLVTSHGNGGDAITINNNTATQSGDRNTIVTTITPSNNTLTELDIINDSTVQDTLDKLLYSNNTNLNNNLTSISDTNNAVSFAYQWQYNLAANQSFQIQINSNAATVPFEFSPSLGILLSGSFFSGCYLKSKLKIKQQSTN
jgi:hypothetical protein